MALKRAGLFVNKNCSCSCGGREVAGRRVVGYSVEDRAPCPASPSEPYSRYPSLSKDFHGTAMLMEMSELCER